MTLLRIRASLADAPVRCQWALVNDGKEAVGGEGPPAQLPRHAERVQLVIPSQQVLIARARVPHKARRHPGSVLAYAVEDAVVGEPDSCQVSWLGTAGDADVLAVIDKASLKCWLDALEAAGISDPEVHCETLLLPWMAHEWTLAWDGREGFLRTGQLEGASTDSGNRESPPLSLSMMLDEAQTRRERPSSIAVYLTTPDAAPDLESWQHKLGVALHVTGRWDWRTAPTLAGVSLVARRRGWRLPAGILPRLRPAAWLAGAALVIHGAALITDWTLLSREQYSLRQQMVTRFRAAFPDTVAVVDPVLQMRRKLAEARHAAGLADQSDFLPMIEQVAVATKALPAGIIRTVAYEAGQMTLELSTADAASVQKIMGRLVESGLSVDKAPGSPPAAGAAVVLRVRAS